MKTQNTKQKLDFTKKAIIELTDAETVSIIGGTGFVCSNCMTITQTIVTK